MESAATEKKPGRPKGSRNREKPKRDYTADPDTLIARQLAMLEMAQGALRDDMQRMLTGDEKWVRAEHVTALERLSNAIVRSIDAMKKSAELYDELSSRLTAEQLLEAAIKKLEGQDRPTIRYAVKRLRARLEVLEAEQAVVPLTDTAADAIAGLE